MQILFDATPLEQLAVDALALICFEAEEQPEQKGHEIPVAESLTHDPDIANQGGWLSELRNTGEFIGKLYEIAILHRPQEIAAKRLVVIGGGKRTKFSCVELRRLSGVLVRAMKTRGIRTVALHLEGSASRDEVTAAVEGAILGAWEADKYKTDPKKGEKHVESLTLSVSSGTSEGTADIVDRSRIIAEAQNFARDLVNEPANKLTPLEFVEAAREMASEYGLGFKALDREAMSELKMGALLGVAQGSDNPPFLVVLEYHPARIEGNDHLALVGKGVTFDTGGVSIKPSEGMEKMKYDMAGAGAVLGAMRAIAQLKPSIPVTAYAPLVENMVNGRAQRPGDIVTAMSGKTIEVLNTDAEGRLILADAITYAIKNGATHLVDAATLTGAIGVALGHFNMGAFTNNQDFLTRFLAASRAAGEKAWQLPMDDEYKDYLKSAFADLPNIGGRYGGSITGAWFIREFADPLPWIHLDIASTAWLDEAKAWSSKGPTGVAVRSFVRLALDWQTRT